MKACRVDTTFRPVTLTLESQAEVDAIYTMLNHPKLCETLGLGKSDYKSLEPLDSHAYPELYHKLCALMK